MVMVTYSSFHRMQHMDVVCCLQGEMSCRFAARRLDYGGEIQAYVRNIEFL
jgi:hypothetical protein